jgi:hypothetical protein
MSCFVLNNALHSPADWWNKQMVVDYYSTTEHNLLAETSFATRDIAIERVVQTLAGMVGYTLMFPP